MMSEIGETPAAKPATTESKASRIDGQILFDERVSDDALRPSVEVLKWNPKNLSAAIMAGEHYERKHDAAKAKRFCETVRAVNPTIVGAVANLGSILPGDGRSGRRALFMQGCGRDDEQEYRSLQRNKPAAQRHERK
jgi:hypothetical protein